MSSFVPQLQNKKIIIVTILGIVLSYLLFRRTDSYQLPRAIDFNYDIRPILSENCFVCHGPDSSSRKANLRLDIREGATMKLQNGKAAIVPGYANKSTIVERLTSTDPEFVMPPPETNKELTGRQIALIRKWIQQGAKWDKYWAFIPPKYPDLPNDIESAKSSTVIDYLLNQKLKSKGLQPSVKAGKTELIRRVSYLLTGLPPKPSDVLSYLSDDSGDAYEKMVDGYLGSPHFGERWARHWMDLVRYGEHMGHEFDFPISGAFEYRDYLIRAFNQDVPYDLFVKEHLAGDMIENPRYHTKEEFNESIIGTGFFFLGEGKHSPVSLKGEEYDKIDNIIDVTSKTFQALTVSCARCHDHKFDPIPTTDYYAMYGMIESSRIAPQPARQTLLHDVQIKRLHELKSEIKSIVTEKLTERNIYPSTLQNRFSSDSNYVTDIVNGLEATEYNVLGDFRKGSWEGWYTNGKAFGENPTLGEVVFDDSSARLPQFSDGYASSRSITSGLQGALHSPNFIIEHDSIAVRARGYQGTIRIIAENFQLIQNPLWGSFEKVVDNADWTTYKMDVSMVKGHKAYLLFLPGKYTNHQYQISPSNYIEIQYALAFNNSILFEEEHQTIKDSIHAINLSIQNNNYDFPIQSQLAEYDTIASQLHDSTFFMGMTDGEAVFSPVFIRGNFNQQSDEKIPRRFLSAVEVEQDSLPQYGSGRLSWAEAVVDPSNPLTARVMVNRIWHHTFGRGIVETVDNFGIQGKLPSHPALLDYLALHFIDEGWSIKSLIKDILLSESFRRSTDAFEVNDEIDPDNIYLHHFPIRRLEAEAIRDGILATAGTLDTSLYGQPVPIHLTEFMTGRGRPSQSGPLDGDGRRSIYTSVRRNFLSPLMTVFDTPVPFSSFGRRNTTNVPAQSLALLNDPFVHDQANKWATYVVKDLSTGIEDRIQNIYLHAFSRNASPEEILEAKNQLNSLAQNYNSTYEDMKNDVRLWKEYCHTIFNLKEFIHLL